MSSARGQLLPVVLLALASWHRGTTAALPPQAVEKSIFVTVVDQNGALVNDLTTADFAIAEDGTIRELTGVKRDELLFASLLVDTTSAVQPLVRDVRAAVTAFAQEMLARSPESEMEILEFGHAPVPIIGFTKDLARIEKAVPKIFPNQGAESVLLEAMVDAAKNLGKRQSPHRAIVSLNLDQANEASRIPPVRIAAAVHAAGAQLWAVSLSTGPVGDANRSGLLNALTADSGGMHVEIVAASALSVKMKEIAGMLTSQYQVIYKRPAGATPKTLQVRVARPNLRVTAPRWPPI